MEALPRVCHPPFVIAIVPLRITQHANLLALPLLAYTTASSHTLLSFSTFFLVSFIISRYTHAYHRSSAVGKGEAMLFFVPEVSLEQRRSEKETRGLVHIVKKFPSAAHGTFG
jgi:hypothetical protein